MTEAMLPVVVCWACVVYPGDVTEMAWALLCPAMKPTASSPDAVDVTVPELGAVLVVDAPVSTSSGLVVAMPANSWTSKLTNAADAL